MGDENRHPKELSKIKRKTHLMAKVVKITLAGAVVDVGLDKPGIVHISRLQKKPVKRVDDVLSVGDDIDTWVHQENNNSTFLDLTMIKPTAVDWGELKAGMIVKGEVIKLEKFGAFIEIGAERPGLAHISELKNDYIKEVSDAVSVGDEVKVQILEVNRKKKQIKLSLKALHDLESSSEIVDEDEELEMEEVPTAMEIALRRAMDGDDSSDIPKSRLEEVDSIDEVVDEREEILTRTLANKVRTE